MVFSKFSFVTCFLIFLSVIGESFSYVSGEQKECYQQLNVYFNEVEDTAYLYAKYALNNLHNSMFNLERTLTISRYAKQYYDSFRNFLRPGGVRDPKLFCETEYFSLDTMLDCKNELFSTFGHSALEAVLEAFYNIVKKNYRPKSYQYKYMDHIADRFTLDGSMLDPIRHCLKVQPNPFKQTNYSCDSEHSEDCTEQKECYQQLNAYFNEVEDTAYLYAKYALNNLRNAKQYYDSFRNFLRPGGVRDPKLFCETEYFSLDTMLDSALEAVLEAFYNIVKEMYQPKSYQYKYMDHIADRFTLDGSMLDPIRHCLKVQPNPFW